MAGLWLTATMNGQTLLIMDPEDILPRASGDPLAQVVRQDLNPLSRDELGARIALLEGEIARCRRKIEAAVNHRATADGLFRR